MPNLTKYKTETKLISGFGDKFNKELQDSIDNGFLYTSGLSTVVKNDSIIYSAVVTKTTIPHE